MSNANTITVKSDKDITIDSIIEPQKEEPSTEVELPSDHDRQNLDTFELNQKKKDTKLCIERQLIHLLINGHIKEVLDFGICDYHFMPDFWHQFIVHEIFDYWNKYNRCLTSNGLLDLVNQKYSKKKGIQNEGVAISGEWAACLFPGIPTTVHDLPRLCKTVIDSFVGREHAKAANEYVSNIPKLGQLEASIKLCDSLTKAISLTNVKNGRLPDSILASQLKKKPTEYLFQGRFQTGQIVLLTGEPGVAKGAMMMKMIAHITTGTPLPFSGEKILGDVLILSAEERPEYVLLPRLEAVGADLNRVIILNGKKDGTPIGSIDSDIDVIENDCIDHPNIKLILIDPITAFVGNHVKDYDPDVRRFLRPLERLARDRNICVVLIKHYKKGGAKAKEKVSGSMAWIASVRVAMGISVDDEDDRLKHCYVIKSNNTDTIRSFTFRTEAVPMVFETSAGNITQPVVLIVWGKETDSKPDDFTKDEPGRGKLEKAKELIIDFLSDGMKPSKEIEEMLHENNISKSTMYRAKEKMPNVKAKRIGGTAEDGIWYWKLANEETQLNQYNASCSKCMSSGIYESEDGAIGNN